MQGKTITIMEHKGKSMMADRDWASPEIANPQSHEFDMRVAAGGAVWRCSAQVLPHCPDWHALALQSVAGVELVAVCDRAVGRAEALARKFGVAHVYGSLDEMLAAGGLDAVHVLTPPNLHFDAARAVLEAGADVFLEKPMCTRAADCEALVRLAGERGLRLGVGHNFLFAEVYERLRSDVKSGVLGLIDDVVITWHKPLPQAMHGPFDAWMLREPANILFEVGSHSVAHMLDLAGEPETLEVRASNEIELPTGVPFYRRWQVSALKGRTAVELRFSFVPGFPEYTIHVRGSLAAATVDFERNTYTLDQHRASDPDFETHAMVRSRAKSLSRQARETLAKYIKSKLKLDEAAIHTGPASRGLWTRFMRMGLSMSGWMAGSVRASLRFARGLQQRRILSLRQLRRLRCRRAQI